MALIKCKECGKEISSAAAACPNCGKPVAKTTPAAKGCLSVIVVLGVLGWIGRFASDQENSKPNDTPAKIAPAPAATSNVSSTATLGDDKAIFNDAKALDDKFGTDALVHCEGEADDFLRGASRFAFKWDDIGFLEQKFDKILSHVSSPGVLTMVSNKVSIQDGFGAYERIELLCEYDTQAKKVLGYSIRRP